MRRRVVCDSSALAAALLSTQEESAWVVDQLLGSEILGPAVLPFEVGNVIRRQELAGLASPDQAALGHVDLLEMRLQLWPYSLVADRVWELRQNVTAYDASYVAVAESVGVPLVTLDRRLARASGLHCEVRVP